MNSMLWKPTIVLLTLAFGACGYAQDVNFSRDIRPILSGRCFKCHGPDENSREADLRLDQRKEAIEFEAIAPGAPDESSLLERVATDDPDLRMPPSGDPLSAKTDQGTTRLDQGWSQIRTTLGLQEAESSHSTADQS